MLTVIITYKGELDNLKHFVDEMFSSGTVDNIRKEEGNMRYEYFFPLNDNNRLILIDSWKDQESLDRHHASNMMSIIIKLRNKYNLHMEVEKYISIDATNNDISFIRK